MQRPAPAAPEQQLREGEHCEQRAQCEEQAAQQAQRDQGAPPAALAVSSSLQRRPRVLLAASGSVATIKLAQLAELLLQVCARVPWAALLLPGQQQP